MRMALIDSPVGAEIVLDGRRYINFAGSSYLGLSGRDEILEAGVAAIRQWGAGYQISRQHDVDTRACQEAQSAAATLFGSSAALYMAAGYYFGLVALTALRGQFDAIFFDELAHYCLRDAIAGCGLQSYAFRHLDSDDLLMQLRRRLKARERPLVVTDGLYSTLGEVAPLAQFARAVEPYGGRLLVDESHSFGVLGPTGRGATEQHQLPATVALRGGSLSKAFGTSGGIILGTRDEVAAFQRTPPIMGASAGLPAGAAMAAASLRLVHERPELLARLRGNISYLKGGLGALGLNVGDSHVPVAAFALQTEESMRALQARLESEGLFVLHTRYIGSGSAGVIRCGIFADHTMEHLDTLLDALRRIL
jgi:7-keto-8-aminopelargonate synthetase-like enzyme